MSQPDLTQTEAEAIMRLLEHPQADFPNIEGRDPTLPEILRAFKLIRANAVCCKPPNGTGGDNGCLALTYSDPAYAAIIGAEAGEVFVRPPNPGQFDPAAAPDQAENRHIFEVNRGNALLNYVYVRNVEKVLKQMLMKCFCASSYAPLKHPRTNFTRVSLLQLMRHISDTYAIRTPEEVSKNEEDMKAAFNRSVQPFTEFFIRQEELQEFMTDTTEPVRESTLIRRSLHAL